MDRFVEAEIKNRRRADKALASLEVDGWVVKEMKPEEKTRWDFELVKDGKRCLIEHKHRGYRSTVNWAWQLEGKKQRALLKEVGKNGVIGAYYINTFGDGEWALWRVGKEDYRDWSHPHPLKNVEESEWVETLDYYYYLNSACKTSKALNDR